tara:strand:+ start:2864 stop:4021 length:1158 start_codon:yes stop_codon:yes gene_type:complete
VNEEEFFRKYMNPETGIYRMSRVMGRKAGERDIVGAHLARIHNAKNTGTDFYLPDNEKEYRPLRDKALTDIYGEGFVDMYNRYKPIGEGAYGAVFEKPGDTQRVLKVQREDTLRRQKFGDREVARQTEAASIRRAPKIHSVTDYPYQHETPEDILGSFDKFTGTDNPRHRVTEMDRVKTVDDQGGKIQMLQDYVLKMQGIKPEDRKYGAYDKFETPYQLENARYNLALAKAQLHLADTKGIVHTDLGDDASRTDHIAYDPSQKPTRTKFIDFGHTKKYNHAENMHRHTQNLNLRNEELESRDTYAEDAEHFLEHQAANVKRGLKALGREDEALNFLNEFYDHVDKPTGADLVSANDLVNRGSKIIRMAGFNKIKPMLSDEELDIM